MTQLIVGLGNPGKEYEKTRHNVGFFIVDALVQAWKIDSTRKKFKGIYSEFFHHNGEKILLLKPQTFMNLSGECVQAWVQFLKVPLKNLLIIHDELDLPLGRFKAQWAAGAGGHNGVRSVIECLGSKDFNRLRVGVGHPGSSQKVLAHVLSPFSSEEQDLLHKVVVRGVEAVQLFVEKGLDPVAQLVNKKVLNLNPGIV